MSSSSSSSSSDKNTIVAETIRAVVRYASQPIERPITRRRTVIERNREEANTLLMESYFSPGCTYNDEQFIRRFRMRRELFLRICHDFENNFEYFRQRPDARGRAGFTPIQKCTSAIRQLAFGTCSDMWDEYLKMSERISRDSLAYFCEGVVSLYGKRYLRRPSWSDIQQITLVHDEKHNFPGMLGSLDCMHWEWENCPVAWHGQYHRGDHAHPSIMLEATASTDLWIWHAFFGMAGANNDINVLDQSPLFNDIVNGTAPEQSFIVNDTTYKYGYYLVDGIYPKWPVLIKSFRERDELNEKRNHFKKAQESSRKDIERAFGVLKKKWHIIKNPARAWSLEKIRNAMYAAIILHNMILEDKGKAYCQAYYDENATEPEVQISFQEKQQNMCDMRDEGTHHSLLADLIEHVWYYRPRGNNDEDED